MIELKEKSIQSWRSKLGRFCQKKISLLLSMLRNLRKSDTTPNSMLIGLSLSFFMAEYTPASAPQASNPSGTHRRS